jgi:hypothetical protein
VGPKYGDVYIPPSRHRAYIDHDAVNVVLARRYKSSGMREKDGLIALDCVVEVSRRDVGKPVETKGVDGD